MSVRNVCLAVLAIIALAIVCFLFGPIAQEKYMDCTYCDAPVQLRADPPLQNHWHDSQHIICDDCWSDGRR